MSGSIVNETRSRNTEEDINNDALATKNVILAKAFSLFSKKGFKGVSMRDLAKEVKITPAALYYHFPNKESLFQKTIEYAYKYRSRPAVEELGKIEKTSNSPITIDSDDSLKTIEAFVFRLCERFYLDQEFCRLVQWTLIYCGSDPSIRQIIIKVVYETHFDILVEFLNKHFPKCDGYKLTIFIFGMVMQNYFTLDVRRDHHGYNEKLESPEVITREIMSILDHGMLGEC